MIENFLHYIWLYKKIDILHLKTTQLEPLEVISVGFPNPNSGPDFFIGQLRIGEHIWVGNIEIHIRSSDWYIHNHQNDKAYDNVILHVVYEHDADIFRADNSVIPTLELKTFISNDLLSAYKNLIAKGQRWINCETSIDSISRFTWIEWTDRLYFERLEDKSRCISELFSVTKANWEATLFLMLAKTFGSKVNGDTFLRMARSFDFSVLQKVRSNAMQLEALFFGQVGLLDNVCDNAYYMQLKSTYKYLRQKFQLENIGVPDAKFFRLRPINFPTIRLSQLANLYAKEPQLFSKVIDADNISIYYDLFDTTVSKFWEWHYTFDKASKSRKKSITKTFIDLIIINTVLPLKFFYSKQKGLDISDHLIKLISSLPTENNHIIRKFNALKVTPSNAMSSQALIQLKTVYCDHNKCLKCAVGHELLSK